MTSSKALAKLANPKAKLRDRLQIAFDAGNARDKDCVPTLIRLLHEDASFNMRLQAAQSLGTIGDVAAIDALLADLDVEKNVWVRRERVNALGRIGDKRVVQPLIQILESNRTAAVRDAAAFQLGRLDDSVAIPSLIEALKDHSNDVRWHATEALTILGKHYPEVVDRLIAILRSPTRSSALARQVVAALEKFNMPKVVDAFIDTMSEGAKYSPPNMHGGMNKKFGAAKRRWEKDADVRMVIAIALGEVGDKRAIDALVQCLKDPNEPFYLQRYLQTALGKLGVEVPRLLRQLRIQAQHDSTLQHLTLKQAKKIDDGTIFNELIKLITQPQDEEQGAFGNHVIAAESLGDLGNVQAIPYLKMALRESDVYTQVAAAIAMYKLGDASGVTVVAKTKGTHDLLRQIEEDMRLENPPLADAIEKAITL